MQHQFCLSTRFGSDTSLSRKLLMWQPHLCGHVASMQWCARLSKGWRWACVWWVYKTQSNEWCKDMYWRNTRDWSVNDVSMLTCVLMSTSSVQIRLCHHLAVGIPPFPVGGSPVWMDPVSPSIWQVLDHITEETIHFSDFNWSHCISLSLWIIIFVWYVL